MFYVGAAEYDRLKRAGVDMANYRPTPLLAAPEDKPGVAVRGIMVDPMTWTMVVWSEVSIAPILNL